MLFGCHQLPVCSSSFGIKFGYAAPCCFDCPGRAAAPGRCSRKRAAFLSDCRRLCGSYSTTGTVVRSRFAPIRCPLSVSVASAALMACACVCGWQYASGRRLGKTADVVQESHLDPFRSGRDLRAGRSLRNYVPCTIASRYCERLRARGIRRFTAIDRAAAMAASRHSRCRSRRSAAGRCGFSGSTCGRYGRMEGWLE